MGGVLIEWAPKKFLAHFFENETEELHERLNIFETQHWLDYDAGRVSREALIRGLPLGAHSKKFADFESQLPNYLRPVPEVIALLEELKREGHGLYCLSNIPREIFHELHNRHDFFKKFDGITASFQHGLLKPDPEIYLAFLSAHSLKADDCFFIDDREENIQGAKACGIEGIVYESPEQLREKLVESSVFKSL